MASGCWIELLITETLITDYFWATSHERPISGRRPPPLQAGGVVS
jgi:hypothetical protein